jgi:hypothetical protein
LPYDEGSTQVDCVISWENVPTTVYIEAKYGADLSPRTAGDKGGHGFPSDQLIRNVRVGLLNCGYFETNGLFEVQPRDFVLIVLSPSNRHELVERYRDPVQLWKAIPHSEQLLSTPRTPFIGQISFTDIVRILHRQRQWFTRPEQVVLDTLTNYLEFKRSQLRHQPSSE